MDNSIKTFELIGTGLVKRAVLSNYGAAIIRLEVQDRYGDIRDIVLGFDDAEDYRNNPAFFGAVVGPIANRTANAGFTLNDKKYSLEVNEGKNNLHFNMEKGFHKRIFDYDLIDNGIIFKTEIKDMEDGLPGNRKFEICYKIEGNALKLEYSMISDSDTVYNPTNHTYFNLNGHSTGKVYGHLLKINADSYTDIDSELIPTGKLLPTKGSDYDYLQLEEFSEKSAPIDHNFCRNDANSSGIAAELMSLSSGIHMKVITDLPGIQVYTGGSIPNLSGKDFALYSSFCGIALETQYYPNSVNEGQVNKNFKAPIVPANQTFKSVTSYEFKNR